MVLDVNLRPHALVHTQTQTHMPTYMQNMRTHNAYHTSGKKKNTGEILVKRVTTMVCWRCLLNCQF